MNVVTWINVPVLTSGHWGSSGRYLSPDSPPDFCHNRPGQTSSHHLPETCGKHLTHWQNNWSHVRGFKSNIACAIDIQFSLLIYLNYVVLMTSYVKSHILSDQTSLTMFFWVVIYLETKFNIRFINTYI